MATLTRIAAREQTISEGEPASLSVEVRGQANMKGKLGFYRDGQLIREQPFDVGASDRAELSVVDPHPDPGVHVYEARLVGTDPISTAVLVGGKPRAIVVALDQQSPGVLHDALKEAEIQEQVITVGEQRLDPVAALGGRSRRSCRRPARATRRRRRRPRPHPR